MFVYMFITPTMLMSEVKFYLNLNNTDESAVYI